ncbi:hypothetical protein Tco_1127063 [Tanacetum coccineum]
MMIREPDSGRIQPLLEVQGKGKEKVVEEQATHDLLTLQTPKPKNPADQFIFQRRTPMPTEPSEHADSPSLDVELALTDSETESEEEVPVIKAGDQDEGQAGPNPGEQDESQAGSNPGDAAESQPQPSHVVHAGPNLEHMDLETTNALTQQKPEQMDEEFTTTAYPNVQENLKLLIEDHVILEEPASSTGTLSSLQNLDKDLSFTGQFFMEKPQEEEPGKTNVEAEVQSIVSVPIHQDTSSVPPMTTLVIDLTNTTDLILVRCIGELEQHITDLIQNNLALEERLDKHGSRLYKLENLNIPHQVSKAVDEIVTDAVDWAMQAPLRARFRDLPTVDIKEILQQQIFEDNTYKTHEVHNDLYEALQKSVELDYSNQSLAYQEEARKKKRKRRESPRTPPGSPPTQPLPTPPLAGASGALANIPKAQELSPTDYLMQDDSIPEEQAKSVEVGAAGETVRDNASNFEGQAYEVVKAFYPDVIHFQFQMEEGPRYSQLRLTGRIHKEIKPESMSTDHCLSMFLQKFYIDRHDSLSRRKGVRTHMRILSVVIIKAYSRYGYDYLSEIVLRRADFQEHTIAEKDFKNLYPSDFEDLNLLFRQGHLDHLPRWDATGYEFKHDYTIIESPRAVVFPVNNNERKIMRFNEIYKFSDGTLTRILETLDYRVKEFKIKRLNPGINTRFWTEKDATRSKEFIAAIERRLKTRRIYQNLE